MQEVRICEETECGYGESVIPEAVQGQWCCGQWETVDLRRSRRIVWRQPYSILFVLPVADIAACVPFPPDHDDISPSSDILSVLRAVQQRITPSF